MMAGSPVPTMRLDTLADVRLGRQRSPKNHSGDQMRPYVRAANVGWNGLLLSDVKEMNFSDTEMDTYRLIENDILLNEASGSPKEVGKPAIWKGEIAECAFQNTLIRVRPRMIDPEYLLHYFRYAASTGQFAAASKGVGIRHLGREALSSWLVPRPDKDEQRRVVDVLDRADALRVKRREAITHLDELAQSVFLDMFGDPVANPLGWPRCSLGGLLGSAGIQNGLYKPSGDYGAGSRIVRIDSFYDGSITELDSLKRVRVGAEELARYQLAVGDILINRVNSREYLGKSAIVPDLPEPTVFESNMMRLRVDDRLADPRFVVYSLQSAFVKAQILSFAKDAVNQSSINQVDVSAILISLPPLDYQHRFVQRLDRIEEQRASYRRQLVELDPFFESLQYRAFRGEL
jgi:type I restriction enzyme S subunit